MVVDGWREEILRAELLGLGSQSIVESEKQEASGMIAISLFGS